MRPRAGLSPNKRTKLLGEIHGAARRWPGEGQRVFNLGMVQDFSDTFTLLVSAGRTPGHPEPDLLAYIGL